jgi:hypothetical protein
MKTKIALLVVLLSAVPVSAGDIALTDGRVLKNATVVSQSPGRVCIRHAAGITQVEKSKLPAELAEQYPATPEAVAAEDAHREELARAAQEKEERRSENWQQQARFSRQAPEPVATSADSIKNAAESYAYRYFRDVERRGTNSSVTWRVSVVTEEPEPISGWANQWRVSGHAAYTDYNSQGWGSFSKDSRKFEVVVLAEPGKSPKVLDLTAR